MGYQVCGSYLLCSYGYYQMNNKCREWYYPSILEAHHLKVRFAKNVQIIRKVGILNNLVIAKKGFWIVSLENRHPRILITLYIIIKNSKDQYNSNKRNKTLIKELIFVNSGTFIKISNV